MRRKRVTGGASIGSAFAYLLLGPQFLLLLLVYGGPVGYLCWLALLILLFQTMLFHQLTMQFLPLPYNNKVLELELLY